MKQYSLPHELRKELSEYIRYRYGSYGLSTLKDNSAKFVRQKLNINRLSHTNKVEIDNIFNKISNRINPLNKQLCINDRLNNYLIVKYKNIIISRGGETEINGEQHSSSLHIKDRKDGLTLLSAEGWRYYSRRFGSRFSAISYLCGKDDNGDWAVRVPGTIKTVSDGLNWITPVKVKKAKGRILRQGDVYVVETKRDNSNSALKILPQNHKWNAETRILEHIDNSPHKPMYVPFPCTFVVQRSYRMGRTSRRGNAD